MFLQIKDTFIAKLNTLQINVSAKSKGSNDLDGSGVPALPIVYCVSQLQHITKL